jgi:hypothetical protein
MHILDLESVTNILVLSLNALVECVTSYKLLFFLSNLLFTWIFVLHALNFWNFWNYFQSYLLLFKELITPDDVHINQLALDKYSHGMMMGWWPYYACNINFFNTCMWDVHLMLGTSCGMDRKDYNNLCDSKVRWRVHCKYVFLVIFIPLLIRHQFLVQFQPMIYFWNLLSSFAQESGIFFDKCVFLGCSFD